MKICPPLGLNDLLSLSPGPVPAAQWIQRLLSVPVCFLLEAHPLHGRHLLAEMAAHASHRHHPGTRHVRHV